jgi:hypothetical protein
MLEDHLPLPAESARVVRRNGQQASARFCYPPASLVASRKLHREVVKAESVDGIPSVSDRDLQCLRATLEDAGIEFIDMVGLKLLLHRLPPCGSRHGGAVARSTAVTK